jgi:hypothetical protein
MTNIFELDLEKKPSQMSSSKSFRCRLAEASLQSMRHPHGVSTSSSQQLPAPVILLDEWMDRETSSVIRKVQTSLERLVDRGAVIVCVTHKPHLYNTDNVRIVVTLCRGAMLPKLVYSHIQNGMARSFSPGPTKILYQLQYHFSWHVEWIDWVSGPDHVHTKKTRNEEWWCPAV